MEQYVYFDLSGQTLTALRLDALIGLPADEWLVRGARRTTPVPVPPCHSWRIVCRDPDLRVDEQAARVLDRLRPYRTRIASLVADGEVTAALRIVRRFDGNPGARLGWTLGREALDFLAATGATIDVDEYGYA
ncbi:hypothetical protein Afil01_55690 [Actinorhabdospora filicis]|uniref:DUF4279 domain-containing protein n=1 Tax=Actinorhabdospora filicis TaxID=1785913 RepID=A0A9W6SRZ7_9ACTN|nr:DUF4279 domain-containing protein [Actinorhabdospora filicis]GLZ80762.1 hypothetical protein Afil01_55690 [Actinorhabdospora filicis]